ncbi:MAG: ABC transporter ATP-binding protein [Deltaproteobacteria bacterium]|nr:ABC transporter ATP-binding protein [Deltaproteobacteria bacterium]
MESLVSIKGLKTQFFLDEGLVTAVDGVDLDIPKGQTLGLVGESGCGKSVMALSILNMVSDPGRISGGQVILHRAGGDLILTDLDDDGPQIRDIRGREIAMIFQEPMTSLSPVHTVGSQVMEAIRLHTDLTKDQARAHTIRMMERVGLPDAARRFKAYPHQLSGGLRQRIMIAMALSCRPSLLIADEPTTALDVTIQAQILVLMQKLQEELQASILLITHDLGVVAQMAHQVAVMYLGRVVEQAATRTIFSRPRHPYTQALLRSIPGRGAGRQARLKTIKGTVPDPLAAIAGCPFHPRCDEARAGLCDLGRRPPLKEVEPGHKTACLLQHQAPGAKNG